jgi:serine/threonine protein kinase
LAHWKLWKDVNVSAEEHLDANRASGPNETGTSVTRAMHPAETAGTVIDRYHLLQKIGEGGMGEVWLAEQREPVRRRIALKLIKAGMNSREVIARFASERQALALMDHRAIAKVFDAGQPEARQVTDIPTSRPESPKHADAHGPHRVAATSSPTDSTVVPENMSCAP